MPRSNIDLVVVNDEDVRIGEPLIESDDIVDAFVAESENHITLRLSSDAAERFQKVAGMARHRIALRIDGRRRWLTMLGPGRGEEVHITVLGGDSLTGCPP